jgi:hypothetical protein
MCGAYQALVRLLDRQKKREREKDFVVTKRLAIRRR